MIEFKISDFFYVADLAKTYWLMRQSEHWTAEQFKKYQAERLARLLVHCYHHVPHYTGLFKEIGLTPEAVHQDNVFEWFQRLPLLDKDTLRATPRRFLADCAADYHPKEITTSGTTGTPLTVYWDRGSNADGILQYATILALGRISHRSAVSGFAQPAVYRSGPASAAPGPYGLHP